MICLTQTNLFVIKTPTMLKLFKRKSIIQQLDIKYQRLLAEAHRLSSINRSLSDAKIGEAEQVFLEIEAIRNRKN